MKTIAGRNFPSGFSLTLFGGGDIMTVRVLRQKMRRDIGTIVTTLF